MLRKKYETPADPLTTSKLLDDHIAAMKTGSCIECTENTISLP